MTASVFHSLSHITLEVYLKVQPCKLCDKKYMIVSTQILNTEFFAFIAVLVFKLLSRKVTTTETVRQ